MDPLRQEVHDNQGYEGIIVVVFHVSSNKIIDTIFYRNIAEIFS